MNLIFVVTDTLRADFLGCYGNPWIKTPHIDAFAQRAVRFNNCHGEGLPTIQARRVFMTGHETLPFPDVPPPKGVDPRMPGWGPLSDEDVTLADFLHERGYWNGMVSDLWHMFKPSMNYHRSFDTWEFIRGQEKDPWRYGPKSKYNIHDYVPDHLIEEDENWKVFQYLYNTEWFRGEEDYFCARTMRSAVRWLENCRDRSPFFLYIDTFDPHEVFDPPKKYALMYHDQYPMERPYWGYGTRMHAATEEDATWVRALYAGKVSLVDTWFGYLMENIDRLGLSDDTVIALVSDHGTEFFEHGEISKGPAQLYRNVTRLPLLISTPKASHLAGKQSDALISAVDIAPALLRLIGQKPPDCMTGLDLWRTAAEPGSEIRDQSIIGYDRSGAVRTHDWLLHMIAEPHAKFRGPQEPTVPRLFDLKADPAEMTNVIGQHPDVTRKLLNLARRIWPDAECALESDGRRGGGHVSGSKEMPCIAPPRDHAVSDVSMH